VTSTGSISITAATAAITVSHVRPRDAALRPRDLRAPLLALDPAAHLLEPLGASEVDLVLEVLPGRPLETDPLVDELTVRTPRLRFVRRELLVQPRCRHPFLRRLETCRRPVARPAVVLRPFHHSGAHRIQGRCSARARIRREGHVFVFRSLATDGGYPEGQGRARRTPAAPEARDRQRARSTERRAAAPLHQVSSASFLLPVDSISSEWKLSRPISARRQRRSRECQCFEQKEAMRQQASRFEKRRHDPPSRCDESTARRRSAESPLTCGISPNREIRSRRAYLALLAPPPAPYPCSALLPHSPLPLRTAEAMRSNASEFE
jgi:hypothetical protein